MAGRIDTTSRQNTKEKILIVCRDLFNERGPESVTTAEIAAAVGINEGNLYYHFRRKELMLEALFVQFETDLHKTAGQNETITELEFFRDYIESWFRLMWAWRFFYRDGASIHRLAPGLQQRLKAFNADGQARTRAAIDQFAAAGLIKANSQMIDKLVVNAWIIATYWIDFLRSTKAVRRITPKHLDDGAQQIMALFDPYLTARGRRLAQPSA